MVSRVQVRNRVARRIQAVRSRAVVRVKDHRHGHVVNDPTSSPERATTAVVPDARINVILEAEEFDLPR